MTHLFSWITTNVSNPFLLNWILYAELNSWDYKDKVKIHYRSHIKTSSKILCELNWHRYHKHISCYVYHGTGWRWSCNWAYRMSCILQDVTCVLQVMQMSQVTKLLISLLSDGPTSGKMTKMCDRTSTVCRNHQYTM